jgi:hypothetical protein
MPVLLTIVVAIAAACAVPSPTPSATPPATPSPSATPSPTPSPAATSLTLPDAAECPVTLPEPGPSHVSPDAFFGWGASHGNGTLWVGGLWEDGIIAADEGFVDQDGAIGMKFGWWRDVPGRLTITGHRLDGPAPPARGEAPEGYGDTGFQASGVIFPVEGCWEIEGRVGDSTLTFVTFVIRQPTA